MNRSNLTEIVTMLVDAKPNNNLIFNRFEEVIKVRACITALHSNGKLYELIIPILPISNTFFTAVSWNEKIYKIINSLKPFKDKFLKGTIQLYKQ